MPYASLIRRYVARDPHLEGDISYVCNELGMSEAEASMVHEVFDADNEGADPFDKSISVPLLMGWIVLLRAMKRAAVIEYCIVGDALADIKLAIEEKKMGAQHG